MNTIVHRLVRRLVGLGAILLSIVPLNVGAQTSSDAQEQQTIDEAERLQKLVENPVSNMVTVPFQNETNFPIGSFNRTQNVFNLQPVIPFRLNDKWNLVARVIVPLVSQPHTNSKDGIKNGLGDLNSMLLLSPAKPPKLIWGVGPVLSFPIATNSVIGSGKWAAGPSVVAVVQPGHWTLGALANNLWSVGGDKDRRDVNSFLLQFFVNYNFVKGWYFTSSPNITSNWKLDRHERWSVPLGFGLGRVFKYAGQSFNSQASAYYTVVHPDSLPYPKWQVRLQLAWLFPLE
jgi:hypothetical protein